MAHTVASLPYSPSDPIISHSRLRQIFRIQELQNSTITQVDDPFENLFTEGFAALGNDFVIFPGVLIGGTYNLRRIIEGCSSSAFVATHPKLADDLMRLARSVLALSTEIARRANLSANTVHQDEYPRLIDPPDSTLMRTLKRAVTFTADEIDSLLQAVDGDRRWIDAITTSFGTVDLRTYEPDTGALYARPILRTTEHYIVVIPSMLPLALWNSAIAQIIDAGDRDEFVSMFADQVWADVSRSLSYLGNRPVMQYLPTGRREIRSGLFSLDQDKLLYVVSIVDDLIGYDSKSPLSKQAAPLRSSELELQFDSASTLGREILKTHADICFLLVAQSPGRGIDPAGIMTDTLEAVSPLIATAEELSIMARLEGGNPLFLRQFAVSLQQFQESSNPFAWSTIDQYFLYRQHNHSFVLSDDAQPKAVLVQPGGRAKILRELLDHGFVSVLTPSRGNVVDVGAPRIGVPIVSPLIPFSEGTSALVTDAPIPIWVLGLTPNDDTPERRSFVHFLVDSLSYWLWQFLSFLQSYLEQASFRQFIVIVEVGDNLKGQDLRILPSSNSLSGRLGIVISNDFFTQDPKPDNTDERKLLQALLPALISFLQEKPVTSDLQERIDAAIENVAPLGQKRMLLLLDGRRRPDLDGEGLPPYRPAQASTHARSMGDIAEYIHHQGLTPSTQSTKEERTELLNEIVRFLFDELHDLVDELDSDGLVEELYRLHERNVYEVSHRRATLATRLACFGDSPGIREEILTEVGAAEPLGTRFLIEYVTAQPPSGNAPLSIERFDRMLETALLIFQFGWDSDLIYFNLADIRYTILPSGRLGSNRNEFQALYRQYMLSALPRTIQEESASLARHWSPPSAVDEDLEALLGNAVQAEFGFKLMEVLQFLDALGDLAAKENGGIVSRPYSRLVAELEIALGWKTTQVQECLSLFLLTARVDFFDPGSPFKSFDVFPWRFNRALSLLARPVASVTQKDERFVVVGKRQVALTKRYLLMQIFEGRLRAKTELMRKFISRLRNQQSDEFNARVASLFRAISHLVVREKVDKVDRLRIRADGHDLGDIDVLVADPIHRRLFAIECKDLAAARTPAEMENQLTELLGKNDDDNSKAIRHQRRTSWLTSHLSEVLRWLGCESSGKWVVKPYIVVDEEVFSPYLRRSQVEVVPFENLNALIT
ncbi:MAG: hypothetical protein U0556_00185 [Dehalococcoidia bacterium]